LTALRAAAAVALAFASLSALAELPTPSGTELLLGYGKSRISAGHDTSVSIYGLALDWGFWQAASYVDGGRLDARLVSELAYWHGNQRPTANDQLWNVGLMPVLRWTQSGGASPRFFAEAGVGGELLSSTRINNDQIFSTAFQFGESAAVGLILGPDDRYELGLYIEHVSNANIKRPNYGLTQLGLLLRIALR
jgi:lipid A 3-O-deacylase